MIKAKQVFFWTSNLKGQWQRYNLLPDIGILFIICAACKTLFSWNQSSTSKVMAIYTYDAENVEFQIFLTEKTP